MVIEIMSSASHKKHEEKLLLRHFREIYDGFPKGKLIATESPDFILKPAPKQTIGIELMRLHKDKTDTNAFAPRSTEHLKRKLILETQQQFESQSGIKCYLVFYFAPYLKLSENDIGLYSLSLSQLINDNIKEKDQQSPFRLTITDTGYPEVIKSIRLLYHPAVSFSYWTSGVTFLTSSLTRDLFVRHIREKEEKMKLYQKKNLDRYWLILLTDFASRSTSFNLHNKLSLWSFQSIFHKVFLFEIFKPGIYELK